MDKRDHLHHNRVQCVQGIEFDDPPVRVSQEVIAEHQIFMLCQAAGSDKWGREYLFPAIWFPLNHLIIEALKTYHDYYGDSFKTEFPTNSGNWLTLKECAEALSKRLTSLFVSGKSGSRPCFGKCKLFQEDKHFKDLVLFHEFFHGDTGKGLGASHQTGWTALVASLISPVE